MAEPCSLEGGPVRLQSARQLTRRGGQQSPGASAQGQSGSSWEGVHAACAQTPRVENTTYPPSGVTVQTEDTGHPRESTQRRKQAAS